MNERQSKLLAAIIDQFIETALPVGSKKLLESGEFICSSATIRNEMGQLEDEGFWNNRIYRPAEFQLQLDTACT